MLVKRTDMIRVTEDHGGYLAGLCVLCGAHGWLDCDGPTCLKHKDKCPVDSNVEYLRVTKSNKRRMVIT